MWKIYIDQVKSNEDSVRLKASCRDDGYKRQFTITWLVKENHFENSGDWLTIRGWDGAEAEASDVAREFIEARRLLKRTRKGKETEQAF